MMDNATIEYKYGNAIDGDELRILTLEPSDDFNSVIFCRLETRPRTECTDYTALSYCWGRDDQRRVRISVHGLALQIRENLATALRHLRWPHQPRRLWIDAICIDQSNYKEKSAQVRRMADTYEKSSRVVVWLGPASEDAKTSVALKAIDTLGSKLDDIPLRDVPGAAIEPVLNSGGCGMWEYLIAMIKLQQNDWFTRLWVVQEICLAPREVTIMCGPDEVSFWKLTHLQINSSMMNIFKALQVQLPATGYLRHRMLALSNEPPIGLTRQYFVAAGQRIDVPGECTLLSHLWNFRNRQCSDPLDRVYALLGIAKDKLNDPIYPDYTCRKEDVYKAATKAIINTHDRLYVMVMCHEISEDWEVGDGTRRHESQESSTADGRPSWVPDFDLDPTMRPTTGLTKYTGKEHYFAATGDSAASVVFEGPLEMLANGYRINIIEDLGCYNFEGTTWEQTLQQSRHLAYQQVEKEKRKHKTDEIEEAFWRTLLTNRNRHNGLPSQETEGQGFATWWKTVFSGYAPTDSEAANFHKFRSAWLQHFHFRNFFTTYEGYIGLCPLAAKPGDQVYLLAGSQAPFVLRQHGEKHRVVGECYVHGAMQGEAWEKEHCKRVALI